MIEGWDREIRFPLNFTLTLEDVFKQLDWGQNGISMDGRYLNHLCFADEVVLISEDLDNLQEMLSELENASEEVRLSMNLAKTKKMSPEVTPLYVGNNEIQRVEEYWYLSHLIRLEKGNQEAEINRRNIVS